MTGWPRTGRGLRGVHHQPMPINKSTITAIARVRDLLAVGFVGAVGDGLTTCALRSQGSTIRNKSIGTEMFFNSVGASFSKRASNALRVCRSTSIDTQMPPAPANGSILD